MHTVYIHIDEELDGNGLAAIQSELGAMPEVTDVEVNSRMPHDLLVEYQPRRGMPMPIIATLSRLGLHADVMSC